MRAARRMPCRQDDPQAGAEARRLYEKAIELDPGYARAYALLAAAICDEWLRDMTGSDSALDRALSWRRRPSRSMRTTALVSMALGWIHLLCHSYDLAEHSLPEGARAEPEQRPR